MIPDYKTYPLSRKQLSVFCIVAATVIGGWAYLFYNSVLISLFYCGFVYPASRYYSKYLAYRLRRELSYQFRDLLYALSSSISAGRQMREALIEAESSVKLIYGEKACISQELKYMIDRMKESGETEEVVLRDFALRSGIADIKSFSDIYSICKRTGGDMEKVIRKAVTIMLDRIELEREVHTFTAQKRMEFIILTAMPPFVLMFLRLTSGSYLEIMYETLAGKILMTLAFLLIGAAAALGIRITRISL
ncbi:MAG: type II secretion system F family protein [Anaerovoracaceae bacterium]|jgi:tight adherence protein B